MGTELVSFQAELGPFGRRWSLLFVVHLWLITSGSASAQIQLDRFFPASIAAGDRTSVVAEGKFPTWPVSIKSSREDIEVSVGQDSGKLEVVVPDDAPPGVAWVRLFDSKSASQLVPILIARVPVTVEKEPNDLRSDANRLELPAVVAGRLQNGGDSDCFRVSVRGGSSLVVSATANQVLQSPMDAVLQITDLRGNVLAQSDDQRGLDPQLVFTPESDQELLIRVFAFPSTPNSTVGFGGSAAFVYTLDVTQGPFLDHAVVTDSESLPFGYNVDDSDALQVHEADEISPPIAFCDNALGWCFLARVNEGSSHYFRKSYETQLPAVVFGHFRSSQAAHVVSFAANAETKYRAEVRSKVDGFLLDSKLDAIDAKSGNVLASNDDVSRGGYDAAIEFTAKSDGMVDIKLTEMLEAYGPRHYYRLSIRPVVPTFQLGVATDRFVLTADKPTEITVSIDRKDGFTGKIQIEVEDLPAGLQCKRVISEAKGDSSKSVKLVLEQTEGSGEIPSSHHSIRVTGREVDNEVASKATATAATFALRPSIPIEALWLTIVGKEKASQE